MNGSSEWRISKKKTLAGLVNTDNTHKLALEGKKNNWSSECWFCLYLSSSLSQSPQPKVKDFITFLSALCVPSPTNYYATSSAIFLNVLTVIAHDGEIIADGFFFSPTCSFKISQMKSASSPHLINGVVEKWVSDLLTCTATSVDHQSCILGLKRLLCGWHPSFVPPSSPVLLAITLKSLYLLHGSVSSLIAPNDYLSTSV